MAAIAMFIFQQGSRNAFNNLREEAKFAKHYRRLFKCRLPHLDTVHNVLCRLPDEAKNGFAISLATEWIANPAVETISVISTTWEAPPLKSCCAD